MNIHHVEEQDLVRHLVSLISGKARTTYNEVDAHADYSVVKQAILDRLEATPDASRVKLRRTRFWFGDDIGDYVMKVKTLARQCIDSRKGFK